MSSYQKINLSNLKSCDQYWEDMREDGTSRLCEKCNHSVFDFRKLNDQQVAELHMFTPGKVCGLYTDHQLKAQQKLKPHTNRKPIYISILSMLLSGQLNGQEPIQKDPTVRVDSTHHTASQDLIRSDKSSTITKDSIIVTGILTDDKDNPIIGGGIHIKGTEHGTISDINGFYMLNVTDYISGGDTYVKEMTLVYSYIGYTTRELTQTGLISTSPDINIDLSFREHSELIAFYVRTKKPPIHKRIGNRIKRLFSRN